MICQVAQARDFVKVLDFGLAKPFGAGELSQPDGRRRDAGHARIHGARGGARRADGRRARRSVRARMRRLRPADRNARLYRSESRGRGAQTHEDPAGSAVQAHRAVRPARSRAHHSAVPRERSGARPARRRSVERMLAACDVPPWTEEDAAAWWTAPSAAASPLRSFSQAPPQTPPPCRKPDDEHIRAAHPRYAS